MMDTVQIGENAGRIWQTLSDQGEMSLSQVKKKTTLKDLDASMALGWLAREDKIIFAKKGKSINVSLV